MTQTARVRPCTLFFKLDLVRTILYINIKFRVARCSTKDPHHQVRLMSYTAVSCPKLSFGFCLKIDFRVEYVLPLNVTVHCTRRSNRNVIFAVWTCDCCSLDAFGKFALLSYSISFCIFELILFFACFSFLFLLFFRRFSFIRTNFENHFETWLT